MPDYILQSPSFKGSSTYGTLTQVTSLESAEWGVGRLLDPATGLPAGKPVGELFKVIFPSGAPSGALGTFMTSGARMPSVELQAFSTASSRFPFLRLLFTDVGVEGLSTSLNVGGTVSLETWAFSYRRLRVTYTPTTPTGAAGTPVVSEFAMQNF